MTRPISHTSRTPRSSVFNVSAYRCILFPHPPHHPYSFSNNNIVVVVVFLFLFLFLLLQKIL